jgi:hypothetical protein
VFAVVLLAKPHGSHRFAPAFVRGDEATATGLIENSFVRHVRRPLATRISAHGIGASGMAHADAVDRASGSAPAVMDVDFVRQHTFGVHRRWPV